MKNHYLIILIIAISLGLIGVFTLKQTNQSPSNTTANKNAITNSQEQLPLQGSEEKINESQESAIRLEKVEGKSCYIVELSRMTPEIDSVEQTYRYVVDFGPFGDDCVRVLPPSKEKQEILPVEGYGAGKRIEGTTNREFLYSYSPSS